MESHSARLPGHSRLRRIAIAYEIAKSIRTQGSVQFLNMAPDAGRCHLSSILSSYDVRFQAAHGLSLPVCFSMDVLSASEQKWPKVFSEEFEIPSEFQILIQPWLVVGLSIF
jgi:hypothetical protein